MVKYCCWGPATVTRGVQNVWRDIFILFPKPKQTLENAGCGFSCVHPHNQLNVGKVTKHTYIYSKVSLLCLLDD